MIKNVADYLLLLQINDALFPIGSYTQSYGLETYVQKRLVHDISTLQAYIKQNIAHNLLVNDLLAVKLAYEAIQSDDLLEVAYLDDVLSATKVAFETRSASVKLGSRFAKTVMSLDLTFCKSGFLEYKQLIQEQKLSGHYALLYGAFCSALNLDKELVIIGFAYAQVSSIVNNGVKLIPLSQSLGQKLLKEIQVDLELALNKLDDLTREDLGRSSPAFELRSMQHEKLYSRLYMS